MPISAAARKARLDALGIESWTLRTSLSAADSALQGAALPEQSAALSSPPSLAAASVLEPAAAPPAMRKTSAPIVPVLAAPVERYDAPSTWDDLKPAVAGCMRCKLCKTRTNTVFGVGDQAANLMVVGEGPGADEDAQGEPFVGRAGKLLDEMLRAIGRSRRGPSATQSVYIANVVKCRPPGNRDPEAEEVEACRPYLDRQIELIKPKLILALGRIAAQRLLSTDLPLSKLRGRMHEYGASRTPVLITYHPAYLLRSPGEKAKSWADLKRAHQFLQSVRAQDL